MYCRPASDTQRAHFAKMGHPNAIFSPNQPYGQHTIRKVLKDALTKMGYPGCTGHALRRLFITTLANDPRVSVEESTSASRHSSVAAQRPYQVVNAVSEAARFRALGLKK